MTRRMLGAYIHVPFCASRCDYCAFATWDDRAHLIEPYMDALEADVRRAFVGVDAAPPVSSVFIGGGTPSQVDAARLGGILALIPLEPGAEVTTECNPDDVSEAWLAPLVAAGVNRISIGVQSMAPHVLAALGRRHTPENVERAVLAARAVGLASVNLDLIYGAAGESLDDWRSTVIAALGLGPDHVSAYALTVEAGTPLADDVARHPDDDDLADKYVIVDDLLEAHGLGWYEISNWARSGHRCRHNLLYWSGGDYLAFGSAAHGHRAGLRYWNVRTPQRYIDTVRAGESVVAGSERLAANESHLERLQLLLRTDHGVPKGALPDVHAAPELAGLVGSDGTRVVLTRSGRLLANEVALRLRADDEHIERATAVV